VAPDVLDKMAVAGGYPQSCAGCRKFYAAKNAAELSAVLQKLIIVIDEKPCELTLSPQPSNASFLSVSVDGVSVPRGPDTWEYADPKITFADASSYCAKMKASTQDSPVNVEVRIIETL